MIDTTMGDWETCSWCSTEVLDSSLTELSDGARVCAVCAGEGDPL